VRSTIMEIDRPLDVGPHNTDAKAGGSRFSEGKPGGFWYAPLLGLRLVSEVWTSGAEKYAPMDWREGQSFSSLVNCAFRHMLQVIAHGPMARDDGEGGTGALHVACVVWNMLTLLTFIEMGEDERLNDIDHWRGVTARKRREEMADEEIPA